MFAAELAETHGLIVLLSRRKVFVLSDPGVRDMLVAIVHDGRSLEVSVCHEFFEIEGSVAKPTKVVVEECVERTAPYNVVIIADRSGFERCIQSDVHRRVIQYCLDDRCVALGRNRLVGMIEVGVLVVEPQR